MKLIKTINQTNHLIKLYNQPINGAESITMNGHQYWMIKEFKDNNINKKRGFGKSNITNKQCGNCADVYSVAQFNNDSYSKDGYSHWCKSCCKEYAKTYNAIAA